MGMRAGMGSFLNKESLLVLCMPLGGSLGNFTVKKEKAGETAVQGELRKYRSSTVPANSALAHAGTKSCLGQVCVLVHHTSH